MQQKWCHCVRLVLLILAVYLLSQTESVWRSYRDLFAGPNREKFDADWAGRTADVAGRTVFARLPGHWATGTTCYTYPFKKYLNLYNVSFGGGSGRGLAPTPGFIANDMTAIVTIHAGGNIKSTSGYMLINMTSGSYPLAREFKLIPSPRSQAFAYGHALNFAREYFSRSQPVVLAITYDPTLLLNGRVGLVNGFC
jgi:hypothetical protein